MRTIKFRTWYTRDREEGVMDLNPFITNTLGFVTGADSSDVLMQFTGLLDKNGKEIYEGDVVKMEVGATLHEWSHDEVFKVECRKGCFCLVNEKRGRVLSDCIDEVLKLQVEIIGNIYENPELYETPKSNP